ncbi:hypothetical protein C0J52_18636 [Blattella germanica]|nr:hypothetical protein C0J52_18636 [Blattella germanica]
MFILTTGIPVFNIILAVTLPNHWCHVPGRNETNLTIEEWKQLTIPKNEDKGAGQEFSKCSMYNVSFPADIDTLRDFHEENRNQTVPCQYGWEYNQKWYSLTAPTEQNWVCEKEFYVPTALLFSRLGIIVGTLVFGHLGDTWCSEMCDLTESHGGMIVGAHLVGASAATVANIVGYRKVLCMEISSANNRAMITMLQCVGYTTGMCILPLIAWLTGGHWKWFMILSTMPCVLVFVVMR